MKKDKEFFVAKFCDVLVHETVDRETLEQYVDFCFECDMNDDTGEYTERHHILPRSLFPEFRKSNWNIVTLLYPDHLRAHELLCDGLPENRSMFYAKFLMRCSDGTATEDILFRNKELLAGDMNPSKRSEVRKKISKSKTGVSRPDMVGKRYFGAEESVAKRIAKRSSEVHSGTVPVRLPDGSVIKVRIDDPRYLSGELKCIIGMKEGQEGPTANPVSKAKYHESLQARRDKFSNMAGDEIADHCLVAQESGKNLILYGKLSANYNRLFNYADLDWTKFLEVVGDKVQRLSKTGTTTKRLF